MSFCSLGLERWTKKRDSGGRMGLFDRTEDS